MFDASLKKKKKKKKTPFDIDAAMKDGDTEEAAPAAGEDNAGGEEDVDLESFGKKKKKKKVVIDEDANVEDGGDNQEGKEITVCNLTV